MLRLLTFTTVISTVILIFIGSLVTSTGSGLAVPDWPLAFGTLFPPMVGGVLYEHGHRIVATAVGVLVLFQAIMISSYEKRKWIRILAWLSTILIIFQGILGGITVLFFLPTPVSIAHVMLAHSLLLILVTIAYFESNEWKRRLLQENNIENSISWKFYAIVPIIFFIQLFLGALVRHTESGLAIPDFPSVGNMIIPIFDQKLLDTINRMRFDSWLQPVNLTQVIIHFIHRVGAVVAVIILISSIFVLIHNKIRWEIRRIMSIIIILTVIQIALGMGTVLTKKIPIIASLHVLIGAILLILSLLYTLRGVTSYYSRTNKIFSKNIPE